MVELKRDALAITFAEIHADARLAIEFQRTLRIPDDDSDYSLPPGLGRFPLRHVDDFVDRLPEQWAIHGGVMLPMYQSEAMWLNFSSPTGYPFAVKVATGKINAVTGEQWGEGLHRTPQDYLSIPEQPWLDGYCVEEGIIRQFVAMPLRAGYSAEEQLTGAAEHGGIQLAIYPLKAEVWNRLRERRRDEIHMLMDAPMACASPAEMGLAPGGRMRQEIYDDPFKVSDWDTSHRSRCFVHITNSLVWRQITDEEPPTVPPTAEEYARAGLPWFEWYSESPALGGSGKLRGMKSVQHLGAEKGEVPLPENTSVEPQHIIHLRKNLKKNQVREGAF